MGVKDIKKASSVQALIRTVRNLPRNLYKPLNVCIKTKDKDARIAYLKELPEETLIFFLKSATYMVLSTGVVLKESAAEVYMTSEIQSFLASVKAEIGEKQAITKEAVSNAVDKVLDGTFQVVSLVSFIALGFFLLMNPLAAPVTLSIMLFGEMLIFVVDMAYQTDKAISTK